VVAIPPKQIIEGNMLERFKEIFSGLDTAYGRTTKLNKLRQDGKHETESKIWRQPPTDDLWQEHLDGEEPGLGIVPITKQSTCKWGCIDIDQYNLNHKEIIDKTKDLPTILFRSKSGGGHLFLFTKEWVPASLMRIKLKMIASFIGYAKSEIFPKQDENKSEKSVGSYLNLPYHNVNRTVRYAFNDKAEAMRIEEFFEVYDKKALTESELLTLNILKKEKEQNDDFKGIPPCLKSIISQGVEMGQRNETLFNLSIYVKKRFPKGWEEKMHEYNKKYFTNPLDFQEVNNTIKSAADKEYKYGCGKSPLENFCDSKKCALQEFGVGDDTPAIQINSIEKYDSDPPIYIAWIDGEAVDCDDVTLHDPEKFSVACMNQTGKIMLPVAKIVWRKMLAKLFTNLQITEAPESSKLDVRLKDAFVKFASRAPGKTISDVSKYKAFTEGGKTIFKWEFFWQSVNNSNLFDRKYTSVKLQKIFCDLFSAKEKSKKIDNKTVRVIEVPAMDLDTPIIRKNVKKAAPFEVH
jgi:hypothetical protein